MSTLNKTLAAACVGLLMLSSAYAKDLTPQQKRMGECSTAAKGKKGAEYKAAVKECLSSDAPVAAASAPPTQKEKMTLCNAQAKDKALKGDERKSFMSSCLKG